MWIKKFIGSNPPPPDKKPTIKITGDGVVSVDAREILATDKAKEQLRMCKDIVRSHQQQTEKTGNCPYDLNCDLLDAYIEADESYRKLVRDIDVLMNGEENAAKQASLCDLMGQIEDLIDENYRLKNQLRVLRAASLAGLIETIG